MRHPLHGPATPLTSRSGVIPFAPCSQNALHFDRKMIAAGVTPPETVIAKTQQIY
jgi:hypothetical protein